MKPRVAWFSCFDTNKQESNSLSAYFSQEIVPLLSAEFEIELYSETVGHFQDRNVNHFLTAAANHKKQPYDIFFYQIEDGIRGHYARSHASLIPGVTLFHDYLCVNPGPDPLLDSAWKISLANYLGKSEQWAVRGQGYHEFSPYALREGAFAAVPLFSTERNVGEWRRTKQSWIGDKHKRSNLPDALYLPLPVNMQRWTAESTKREKFTVACASPPWMEFRAHKILEAISGFGKTIDFLWLVNPEEKIPAQELLEEFGITTATLVEGRSANNWGSLVASADLAIHTLFSVYGQPGPYLQISLASGIPAVVTNFGASEYLPESVVFKIEPGDTESAQLKELIGKFIVGELQVEPSRLRNFVHEMHDSGSVALELASIFRNYADLLKQSMSDWQNFQNKARQSLLQEALNINRWTLLESSKDISNPVLAEKLLIEPVLSDLAWEVKA